jgi:hypothetical protein
VSNPQIARGGSVLDRTQYETKDYFQRIIMVKSVKMLKLMVAKVIIFGDKSYRVVQGDTRMKSMYLNLWN